jgi:hypothetical protein
MTDDPEKTGEGEGEEPEAAPPRRRGFDADGNAVVQYIVDGNSYIIGVPRRDLSGAEFLALPDVEKNAVIRSPLYDYEGYQHSRDAVAANGGPLPNRSNESAASTAAEMKAEANAQRAGGKGR